MRKSRAELRREAFIDGLLAGIIAATRGKKCAAQALLDVFSESPRYFHGYEYKIFKHEVLERLPHGENAAGETVYRFPDGSHYVPWTGEVIEPEEVPF